MTHPSSEIPPGSDRSSPDELMRRQAAALERLALVSDPEYVPRTRALKRLAGLVVALGGGVLAAYEFANVLYDSYVSRKMVGNWVGAAQELYEVESSPDEAALLLAKASDLRPQDASVIKTAAYIDGMRTVETLLNLDRPFNEEDMEKYGAAVGQAIMLEKVAANEPEWASLRGQLALAVGELDRASRYLKQSLAMEEDNAFAHLRLGLVHYYRAEQARKAGNEKDHAKEMAECQSKVDYAVQLEPRLSVARLWKALLALEANRPDEAIAISNELLRDSPRYYKANTVIGQAYLKKAESAAAQDDSSAEQQRVLFSQAQAAYEQALAINPNLGEAMLGLCQVYGNQNKYEIGLRFARRCTSTNPGSLSGWSMHGRMARELARANGTGTEGYDELMSESVEGYSKALDLDPRSVENYIERSELFLSMNKLRQAGEDARNATLFGPEDYFAWDALGKYLLAAGFHSDALKAFTRSIELSLKDKPFDAGYLGRALTHVALGDPTAALRDFDEAVAAASTQIKDRILLERGRAREAVGKREEALADYVASRTDEPESFDAWLAEARVLKDLGRIEESRTAAREAMKLRPDDGTARKLAEPAGS